MLLALWHAHWGQETQPTQKPRIFGGSWVEHKPWVPYESETDTKDEVLDIISELRAPITEPQQPTEIIDGSISDIYTPQPTTQTATAFKKATRPAPNIPTSEVLHSINDGYQTECLLLLSI